MENSVDDLLKRPFLCRSLEEKMKVKELGRPTPNLNLRQKAIGGGKRSEYMRKFNMKVYENRWICGCDVRNALFCFPCLLFGNSDAWSREGVTDLGHINALIKKHNENDKHINNTLDLSTLGDVNIATKLSRAYHEEIVKHNQQVEKNRYVLSRIIDCIKFCGAFELAVKGHSETQTSKNSGVFLGLIDLISDIDSAVKEHVEDDQVFKSLSKCIQNELLDCMLETCHEVMSEEIKETEFAAIMVDETTDVSGKTQLVLVLRYEKNSVPYERFWGLFSPAGHNADALTTCILNVIDPLFRGTPHKIIAQTHDGAAVMNSCKGDIQARIKTVYPNAHYVHCYAHQLNLTMERAASQNQSARVFFLNLSGFSDFFSRSPERLSALETVAARRIPSGPPTTWNFKSQTLNVVYENKTLLLECLLALEKSPSDQTCCQAVTLRRNLQDEEFLFWLGFFHKVMPHVGIINSQLQANSVEAIKVQISVSQFIQVINNIRASIGNNYTTATAAATSLNKRQKISLCRCSDAKEVCDRINREAHDHFQALDHLEAAKLLDSLKFEAYSRVFPERELNVTVQAYMMLEKRRLKTELSVLYQRPEFRNIAGAVPLLQFISNNKLQDTFSQITKLLKILVTTPMTTAEPERLFSSLKRIKTFLQNTMSEQRLSAFAMLSIEKNMVTNIEGFNTKVIDKFCSRKQRHMDFIFRH